MNITHRASIWSGITTAANNELCCRHSLSEVYCVTVLSKWQLNANTKRSRMWCEDAVSAQSQCTSGKSPSPNEGISDSQRPNDLRSSQFLCTARTSNYPHCQWRTQEFCSAGGRSTNSDEDRGQTERGDLGR